MTLLRDAGLLIVVLGTSIWAGTDIWTPLGPDGGGANLLALDPLTPGTVYASTNGGIFKSADGSSWNPTGAGVRVSCLTVDSTVRGVLYLCTPGDGVFKSTDGGASWKPINSGLSGFQCTVMYALTIDPYDASTLYAGSPCGVFKSTDAGASWSAMSRLGGSGVVNLAIDAQNPSTLYAATCGGPFQSTDAGANWKPAGTGLPVTRCSWPNGSAMAVDPRHPKTLFFSDYNGLFQSTDGAQSWSAVNFPAKGVRVMVVFDPGDSNILYGGASVPTL